MPDSDPTWDDQLFKGTARYYEQGRMPYAESLVEALRDELGLDGQGTLVDFGSGPGTLALLLAPAFASVLAVEPDSEMADIGSRNTQATGATNVRWQVTPAEDVRLEPSSVDAAVFGQSYHWMDRPTIAAALRAALRPGGHFVLITDVKRPVVGPGIDAAQVPNKAVKKLIVEYLGELRRAGRSVLPQGTPNDEESILHDAGYLGPKRLEAEDPGTVFRSVDSLMAEVYSKSSSAPHLFRDRIEEFDARLRGLLEANAVDGGYQVTKPGTDVRIWTNP
jgi:SAM-dependent methyltransferase